MRIYANGSFARAMVFGLIMLAPASMVLAQGNGPLRSEEQQGPDARGPQFRNGNRSPQAPRQQALRGTPPRGQQGEARQNQAFRPNFDNQGQSRRLPPMSAGNGQPGVSMTGGKKNAAADVNRRQPQQPPIMIFEFTNPENCAPCRKVAPIVADLIEEGYPIMIVDLGKKPELAEKFHIESIPSFVRVENGRETGRLEGAQDEDDLVAFCDGDDFDDENGDDDDDGDFEIRAGQENEPRFVNRPNQGSRGPAPNDRRQMDDDPRSFQGDPRSFVNNQRPLEGNRGPTGRRPANTNREQFYDSRLANNQRMPFMNDSRATQGNPAQLRSNRNPTQFNPGQAMHGQPSNFRRTPPTANSRAMNGNAGQFMSRGTPRMVNPEAFSNGRRATRPTAPQGPDAG